MTRRVPFLALTVILQSPGHFGSEPLEGNLLRSLSYIPAQTVRGALANLFRQHGGKEIDEAFFTWAFLSGAVRWPSLYFTGEPFLPKSVRQCKDNGGTHPRVDFSLGTYHQCQHPDCAKDQVPLERAEPGSKESPLRIAITRTALWNKTRGARDGSLHTIEALREEQEFCGTLYGDPQREDSLRLRAWLEGLTEVPIALGGGRSRGLGEATLSVRVAPEPMPLQDRLEAWNTQRVAAGFSPGFAVTLETPVVLRDKLFRYQTRISADTLGLGGQAINLDRAWSETATVGGWNQLAGLPRPEATAIQRGAVFVFKTETAPSTLLETLQQVEERGIGERHAEGFGAVTICHSGSC